MADSMPVNRNEHRDTRSTRREQTHCEGQTKPGECFKREGHAIEIRDRKEHSQHEREGNNLNSQPHEQETPGNSTCDAPLGCDPAGRKLQRRYHHLYDGGHRHLDRRAIEPDQIHRRVHRQWNKRNSGRCTR